MSASHSATAPAGGWTRRDIRVVRYALGAGLGMAIAMGFAWELSFLVPVLSLSFLSAVDKPLGPKAALAFIAVVGVACLAGLAFGNLLTPYPLVFIPFCGLVLFRIFYAGQLGRSKLLILWLLLAITLIPLISLIKPGLAVLVTQGIFFNVVVTVLIALITFAILPEPQPDPQTVAAAAPQEKAGLPSTDDAFRTAALSTVVVVPLLTIFYLFEITGAIVILVFVAILASQPQFASSFKVGKVLIAGNVLGGIITILFYEILVIAPLYPFLLLMTFLIGMILGLQVFSGKPAGQLFGMAFSTTLLIIGSTTTSSGDASSEVYTRVVQIAVAVVYVVVAFGVLNRLFPRKDG